MFPHFILLAVGFAAFLPDVLLSSCDETCADKPVFTPSSVVVKHGDPTNATCLVCKSCPDKLFGLEKSVGDHSTKGPTILWSVAKMTEWDPSPKCYYNAGAQRCCSTLPVTVYKPPDHVTFSSDFASDQMIEGQLYTLSCTVEQVAPVERVRVTFYRGSVPLGPAVSVSRPQKTPATEVYMINITASKEDNNSEYWCEAKLDLGLEGPRAPPVVRSKRVMATVSSNCLALVPSVGVWVTLAVLSLL
ncbi:uncharacterized protein LOC114858617 [Betta splendens]|uniref:Uncharacterized protein LOC114858617 n=1 Tax=Betta splendens TaxID=158456 RepID=A0A6P7MY23_BETSP|nr:uncharacterized protein LOC114858617 [Betta splendens]